MKQYVCWSHHTGARMTTTSLKASDSDNKRTFQRETQIDCVTVMGNGRARNRDPASKAVI